MIYVTINTTVEFICFLVSLFCLIRDKEPIWRFFILYLFSTVVTEVLGIHFHKVIHLSNIWIYNLFLILECITVSSFLYHLFKPYGLKIKWLYLWFGFFILCYGSELYLKGFSKFNSHTASLMSVVFVVANLLFFYKKITDEHFEDLTAYPPFWWVSGTLFFYFGSTVCNILFDYLSLQPSSAFGFSVNYIIFNVLNIILYFMWSYSFICRYQQQKSLLT